MPKFNFGRYLKDKLVQIQAYYDLKFLLNLLKICGSWPPMNGDKKAYMIWSVFMLFLTSVHLPFIEIAFLVRNWSGLLLMGSDIFMLNLNSIYVLKIYLFLLHQKRIQRFLDYAEAAEFIRGDPETVKKTTVPIIMGYLYLSGVTSIVIRITSITVSYLKDENNKVLPVNGWYPYDAMVTPFYELTLVLQALSLLARCIHGAGLDGFMIGFMSIVNYKLVILKTRVKEIGDDVRQFGTKKYPRMNVLKQRDLDEGRYKELMLCVKQHLTIFDFAEEFQQIFQWAILLQLLNNCGGICLFTLDRLKTTEEHPASWFISLLPVMSISFQIFISCYFGNVIVHQSQSVVDAAYAGNWWRFDERYKHALQLLMIRANQPVVIRVGSIFSLSLPTFVTIMRTTYSFFTVLKTIREKK